MLFRSFGRVQNADLKLFEQPKGFAMSSLLIEERCDVLASRIHQQVNSARMVGQKASQVENPRFVDNPGKCVDEITKTTADDPLISRERGKKKRPKNSNTKKMRVERKTACSYNTNAKEPHQRSC